VLLILYIMIGSLGGFDEHVWKLISIWIHFSQKIGF